MATDREHRLQRLVDEYALLLAESQHEVAKARATKGILQDKVDSRDEVTDDLRSHIAQQGLMQDAVNRGDEDYLKDS